MKLGAIFPTPEIGSDPAAIREWTEAAEGLGFDYILTYDHVLGAIHEGRDPALTGPYTERDAFHEPFVLFGYLAAITRRVELVTGILILPQRQTALVAKQAAEVQVLSEGRMRLGIGTGWNYVEYEALGEGWDDRGKRFDEQVELLRRLWTEPTIDYAGDFHRVDRAGLLPSPGDIPIWFGGFTPVAYKRAARLGDGFLFGTVPQVMAPRKKQLDALREEAGRGDVDFVSEAVVDYSAGPDHWKQQLELWQEAGGTHLSLRAMDTAAEFTGNKHVGYQGLSDYIRALEEFEKAVA